MQTPLGLKVTPEEFRHIVETGVLFIFTGDKTKGSTKQLYTTEYIDSHLIGGAYEDDKK